MFEPGLYEVISGNGLIVRKEPKITLWNKSGFLSFGARRQVYSVATNDKGETWGRVSESDAAGQALWICMQGLNRTYVKRIETPSEPGKGVIALLVKSVADLERRVKALEDRSG